MISSQVMPRFWPPALFVATCLLFVVIQHRPRLNISFEVPLPETSPPISSDPVSTLAGLAAIAPPVPINESCLRPPLPRLPACMDSAFSGEPLIRPRKLALMLLLGFLRIGGSLGAAIGGGAPDRSPARLPRWRPLRPSSRLLSGAAGAWKSGAGTNSRCR